MHTLLGSNSTPMDRPKLSHKCVVWCTRMLTEAEKLDITQMLDLGWIITAGL
jgi:hypothetical protein